jgi:hypothetical protein
MHLDGAGRKVGPRDVRGTVASWREESTKIRYAYQRCSLPSAVSTVSARPAR